VSNGTANGTDTPGRATVALVFGALLLVLGIVFVGAGAGVCTESVEHGSTLDRTCDAVTAWPFRSVAVIGPPLVMALAAATIRSRLALVATGVALLAAEAGAIFFLAVVAG
jgi:hypothetical protein